MAEEGGSVPSSSEKSLSNTGEPESDISKVIDGLRDMRYADNLTQDQKDKLKGFADTLDEHSYAVGPQVQCTPEGNYSGIFLSLPPPGLLSDVERDSGYSAVSFRASKRLLSATHASSLSLSHEESNSTGEKSDLVLGSYSPRNIGLRTLVQQPPHLPNPLCQPCHSFPPGHEQPQQAEEMSEGSLVVPRRQIPKEARQQLVKITSEDEVRRIEEGSLRTTVAAVYHHHYSRQIPVTDFPGSAASDSPSACDVLTDGYISVVLVTEAVAKILCSDLQFTMNTDAVTYWRSFCQMHENKAKIESLPSAETLIGMRHSLAHANTEYCFRLQDKSTVAPMCVLYKRGQEGIENEETTEKELIKVHECTVEQFTQMCATVRDIFLTWKLLAKYKTSGTAVWGHGKD